MTINKLVILDVGPEEFSLGLTYTGSTRTTSLKGMAFEPMPTFNRILKIFSRPSFKQKEAELKKREELVEKRRREMQQEKESTNMEQEQLMSETEE